MAGHINFLTDHDVELLRELLREQGHRRRNTERRPHYPDHDHEAPEAYFALVPDGGIPAYDLDHPTGTGTGSSYFDAGSATCRIFKLVYTNPDWDAYPAGFSKLVFNLTGSAITAGQFVQVIRDKWGSWMAVSPATAGSSGGGGSSGIYAQLTKSANTTLAAADFTTLDWDVPAHDTGSFFSGSQPTRLTISQDGFYTFGLHVDLNESDAANTVYAAYIYFTDGITTYTVAQSSIFKAPGGASQQVITISGGAFIGAGNYLYAQVFNGGAGTNSIFGSSTVNVGPLFWVAKQ